MVEPFIEVIHRPVPAEADLGKPPVLFVHGAFTNAGIWAEHFLDAFAAQGYDATALSLRGHGESDGRDYLSMISLAEYVEDVTRVAQDRLGTDPILIGHSMGGFIVQKYLETHPAKAAVLMASVPPEGIATTAVHMATTDPWLYSPLGMLQMFGPQVANHSVLRRAMFSPSFPYGKSLRYLGRVEPESLRVNFDMSWFNMPHIHPDKRPPMLVLGAGSDALVPQSAIRTTAQYYGADHHIFPDMAHAMMLEENWNEVSDHIIHWLDTRFVPKKAA